MKKPNWLKGGQLIAVSSVLILAAGAFIALVGEVAVMPVMIALVVAEVAYVSMT